MAAADITDVEVDGHRYKVTKAGARTAQRIIFRIGAAFMQSLGSLFNKKGDIDVLGVSVAAFKHLTADDQEWLFDELAKLTQVGILDPHNPGRPPTFVSLFEHYDTHFKGRPMAIYKVAAEALKIQLGPFAVELRGLFETPVATEATGSPSPLPTAPTDSGSSGG